MRTKLLAGLFSAAVAVPVVVSRSGPPAPPADPQPAQAQAAVPPAKPAVGPHQAGGGTVTVPGWPTPVSTTLRGSVTFLAGVPLYHVPPGATFGVALAYGSAYTGSVDAAVNATSWSGAIPGLPGWRLHVHCANGTWYATTVIPESFAQAWPNVLGVTSASPLGLSGVQVANSEAVVVTE